jgi:phosphate transport system protein
MSVHLQQELEKLKMKLLHLGAISETAIERAGFALINLDVNLAREVINSDHLADLKEVEIEEDCLKILALYTPVANDLRFVVAILKINNDLERVCDLAVNIAERVVFLGSRAPIEAPADFNQMWKLSLKMLNDCLEAFVESDAKMAKSVCEQDDEVDAINRQVYQAVYDQIKKDPEKTEALIHYLSISRHFERAADYATNIAEDVIYMVDGEIIRHKPELFHLKPTK